MRRLLLGSTILAMLSATAVAEPAKWGPWVELGGQVGTNRTLGDGNLFVPLWQSPDSLLFADVRGMIDDHDALEANLGLGFRSFLNEDWIVGGYGYFDVRRSALDNAFQQATFGVEALGRYFDLRLNGYLPVGDDEKFVSDLGSWTTTSQASEAVVTGGTLGIRTTTTVSTI